MNRWLVVLHSLGTIQPFLIGWVPTLINTNRLPNSGSFHPRRKAFHKRLINREELVVTPAPIFFGRNANALRILCNQQEIEMNELVISSFGGLHIKTRTKQFRLDRLGCNGKSCLTFDHLSTNDVYSTTTMIMEWNSSRDLLHYTPIFAFLVIRLDRGLATYWASTFTGNI